MVVPLLITTTTPFTHPPPPRLPLRELLMDQSPEHRLFCRLYMPWWYDRDYGDRATTVDHVRRGEP